MAIINTNQLKTKLRNLYNIDTYSPVLDKVQEFYDELQNMTFYVMMSHQQGFNEFEVFEAFDKPNYSVDFNLLTDGNEKEYMLIFLSKESFISGLKNFYEIQSKYEKISNNKTQKSSALVIKGRNLINFFKDDSLLNDKRLSGICIEPFDIDNVVKIEKSLLALLASKSTPDAHSVFTSANPLSEEDSENIKEALLDWAKTGLNEVNEMYYLHKIDAVSEDVLLLDCPKYYFEFFANLIYQSLKNKFNIDTTNFKIMHIDENKVYRDIAEMSGPFYTRNKEIPLLN